MNDVAIFLFGVGVGALGIVGLLWLIHLLQPRKTKPSASPTYISVVQPDMVFVRAEFKRQPTSDQLAAWEKLPPRKQEAALLVARGLSSAEIAAEMTLRKSTVDGYLKEIYRVLDLRSRTELANFVRDLALE